jgi:tetratricopeptide (TPR) repeat protein
MLRGLMCAMALLCVCHISTRATAEEAQSSPEAPASEPATPDASSQETAAAEPSSPREQARTHFLEGVRAYEEGRYGDAIDLLLKAERAMHSPAFAYNIGIAYESMGDVPSALRWLRAYLREVPGADDSASVKERIGSLEMKLQARGVQQATVLSKPEGATVVIDGEPLGATPWTGELRPGKHQVVLRLRGFQDVEHYIEIQAHRAEDFEYDLAEGAAPKAPAAPVRDSPPPADSGGGVGLWTWVALGAGGLALGGAAGFEVARANATDEAREAPQVEYQDKVDTARRYQTTARILAGVGGALLVTGTVLLVLDISGSSSPPVAAGCSGDGCFVSGHGMF